MAIYSVGMSSLGLNLSKLMDEKGIGPKELSKATGIPIKTINEVLTPTPSFRFSQRLALGEYFGVSPNVFMNNA